METKTIESIFIDQVGWRYSTDGEIKVFQVNGEMAPVSWYSQNNEEYNGKYVVLVRYSPKI